MGFKINQSGWHMGMMQKTTNENKAGFQVYQMSIFVYVLY